MSYHFNKPSVPRHSTNGSKRSRTGSRSSSFDHRLSIIQEDGDANAQPPLPQRAHNRPFSRRFFGEPPRYVNGKEPPKYTLWDMTGPKGEKFEDLRNNAYIARRGGWRRFGIVSIVVAACLVALIVGLVVGLHKRDSSKSSEPPAPANSSSPSTGPFPAGSHTFTTFLDSTSTNCTSNSASWTCQPSVTYATSPSKAQATFNWIISATGPGASPSFTISSTDNPFAIDFSDATLSLIDQGSDQERYTFTTIVQKAVFPTFNVKCFYNETRFSANMYTKKPKSYPTNSTAATTSSAATPAAPTDGAGVPSGGAFANWNYAVDATQSIGGGVDVPACYSMNNGVMGNRITDGYTVEPAGNFCSCAYKNYDP